MSQTLSVEQIAAFLEEHPGWFPALMPDGAISGLIGPEDHTFCTLEEILEVLSG